MAICEASNRRAGRVRRLAHHESPRQVTDVAGRRPRGLVCANRLGNTAISRPRGAAGEGGAPWTRTPDRLGGWRRGRWFHLRAGRGDRTGGPTPPGFHRLHERIRLGEGPEVLAAAGRALMGWRMHRATGLRVPAGTLLQRRRRGPERLTPACAGRT
ncbi:DUF1990 family protein [Actinacidiphila sp. bgisy160]|uniref:DUF1990 family protein n=1 Tax=Actinacidiphila sp. bgisy160 TaxID=3413796 RepID=UPI003D736DBB